MKFFFTSISMKFRYLILVFIIAGAASFPVFAQEQEQQQGDPTLNILQIDENTSPEADIDLSQQQASDAKPVQVKGVRDDILPSNMPSVLFTFWEYDAIRNVKKSRSSGGVQRGVTDEELERELSQSSRPQERGPPPPPEEREIVLGGIAFTSKNDWTIWLNGQRVTPDALPSEIIDLRVNKHHIDMKWLDDYTQQIFPIRLRAHQRFNLDSRIFLPG
jgi:hypothetical protein